MINLDDGKVYEDSVEFFEAIKGIKFDKIGQYYNIYAGFDIETTQIKDEKLAFMYIWQFDLFYDGEHYTLIGRKWDDLIEFFHKCKKRFKLSPKKRMPLYIHNFSFEFSFLKRRIQWSIDKEGNAEIFATDDRNIIKALSTDFIEFRDSAILSGSSLAQLAKDYTKTQKMKGDLDYSILRNSKTEITTEELRYAVNDVRILSEYSCIMWTQFEGDIPMTKTGIVRRDIKNAFYEQSKEYRADYKKFIRRAFPKENAYKNWFRYLYCGGYVHSDYIYTGYLIEEKTQGVDFKSSYPFECTFKLPGRFYKVPATPENFEFYGDRDEYGWICDVTVYELHRKLNHAIFSKHKLLNCEDGYFDNGRLVSCSRVRMLLTEFDYDTLNDFYVYERIEFNNFKVAKKDFLPDWLLSTIHKYYNLKNSLPKDSIEYKLAKANLNSIYGCMCTSMVKEDIIYNFESGKMELSGKESEYWQKIDGQVLLPQWGIWVSAGSRRRLLKLVRDITINAQRYSKWDDDVIYCDTDSIKLLHPERHQHILKSYNEWAINHNKMINEKFGLDFGLLGIMDDEGYMVKFKTLGCKRYLYTTEDGVHHPTIAGMPKGSFIKYCETHHIDPYQAFNNKLRIDAAESDKLTSSYKDEPYQKEIAGELMKEMSGVCLFDIPFSMNMEEEYLSLLKSRANKKHFVERT